MSAIEQPAARSGSIDGMRSPPRSASFSGRLARMSAVSAMKCTPQNAIARQSLLVGRQFAEPIAVARQIGERDHFVLLIVMAQDQQPRAQLVADRLNPRGELLVLQRLVGLQARRRAAGLGRPVASESCDQSATTANYPIIRRCRCNHSMATCWHNCGGLGKVCRR